MDTILRQNIETKTLINNNSEKVSLTYFLIIEQINNLVELHIIVENIAKDILISQCISQFKLGQLEKKLDAVQVQVQEKANATKVSS